LARINDPEGTRSRVVAVAYRLFVSRGYAATAVNDVKAEAGISSGAFSHHFPHKQDLVLAVIAGPVAQAIEETWIAPVREAADAGAGIAAVFADIVAGLAARGRVIGCPLNNLALELSGEGGDVRVALDALFRRWRGALSEKFIADRAAGRYPGIDPEAAALMVIAAYSGAMAVAKAAQDPEPLATASREITRYLDGFSG
jgi:AcrR family transcriptional regulator